MPKLLIELFSEEIPARMQAAAAANLARLVGEALAPLAPEAVQTFHGPRRIALAATVNAAVPSASTTERGPRASAPPQALEGFLRKHAATRDQLTDEGGHWVLTRSTPATPAATLIAATMPGLLRRFPWPKSMRWGNGSAFTWVRPLRRILCLLDGAIVPFTLAELSDDGHGLASGNETEGHRFHAPGPVAVSGLATWREALLARHVIPEANERRRRIEHGIASLAAAETLTVTPDEALLDEVAGLVEWPVPLLGRIDAAYMDLPPEVMQVSMRVNQRYFALRHADGTPAPRFAFAANIEATDSGAAIIAGNERVLRARFSDARHFWDLDRRAKLETRVEALNGITFHAKLGTQRARVARIEALARHLAPRVGANPDHAARAAHLCKADLTTGMVGEFPELQGVMGGYYAAHDNEPPEVAAAIRDHYTPRGPADAVPTAPVTIAVALADKIDQLAAFFAIGEVPTGSGDPYALRRAALGVIRIVRENSFRFHVKAVVAEALDKFVANRVAAERAGITISRLANDIRSILAVRHVSENEPMSEMIVALVESQPLPEKEIALAVVGPFEAEEYLRAAIHALGKFSAVEMLIDGAQTKLQRTGPQSAFDFIASNDGELNFCSESVVTFLVDRLRVQLRAEGARHDILAAVFAAGADDDLVRLLARTEAVAAVLATQEGRDLLAGSKRAANILRIEDKKDGPHNGPVNPALLAESAETALAKALAQAETTLDDAIPNERYTEAMQALAALRPHLDAFFNDVTVNAPDPALRRNRLRLLAQVGAAMARTADFSRIEG